jgi:SNF2 family DNA or RNA helicase
LPPIVEIDEPLRMNVSLARDYDERRMQGIATSPAEQFLSLSGALLRICCSQSRDSVDGQPPIDTKFQRMFEILDELASVGEDKVLIFVSWVDAIIQLESILNSRYGQEKIAALHGVTKDRQDLVDSFNEADGFRVLLINPTVGGVGLNITGANHVIHFGRQWNPMLERQATARAWRRGQEKTVFVHKFYYEGTIEDVVQQRLIAKEGLADDVLAGALSEDEDLEQSKARLISPLAVSN